MGDAKRRSSRRIRCAALGAAAFALAAPGTAAAACVSTPGQWAFDDPAGDQWFSKTHSDISKLRVELDAACRLTMEVDVHGILDPEANMVVYDLEITGRPGSRRTLYTTLPRADRPGEVQEVRLGRPQAGGIGFRPEPALAVSGVTGWSGALETFGITTPGELRVRAAVWEYPVAGTEGGPTGTGDAMPNEPGTVAIPLVFADGEPPAPDVPGSPAPDVPVPPVPDGSVPPVTLPDRTPPSVSDLELVRPRPGRPGAKVARRRALRGAAGRYRLSEPATVAFKLQRRGARGRYVSLERSRSHAGAAGANSVRLGKLVAGLRPGAYRLVATASDAAGNRGASRRVRFRVSG